MAKTSLAKLKTNGKNISLVPMPVSPSVVDRKPSSQSSLDQLTNLSLAGLVAHYQHEGHNVWERLYQTNILGYARIVAELSKITRVSLDATVRHAPKVRSIDEILERVEVGKDGRAAFGLKEIAKKRKTTQRKLIEDIATNNKGHRSLASAVRCHVTATFAGSPDVYRSTWCLVRARGGNGLHVLDPRRASITYIH
jgi:hypothetical protein